MLSGKVNLLHWVVIAGLVGVIGLGACSKKSVMSTASGEDAQQGAGKKGGDGNTAGGGAGSPGDAMAKADAGSGSVREGSGSTPLQGFNKKPDEERVVAAGTMIAKVDPKDVEARKAEQRTREAAKRQLADIYFDYDKWALSDEGIKNLAQSAEFLKQNPSVPLTIEGHCDERGSREYNLVLGEKRAKEVRRYLADRGIKNPVTLNSFGKERPVCTEHEESCYGKNRRAHLAVEGGQ